jgi:hypothetical protein
VTMEREYVALVPEGITGAQQPGRSLKDRLHAFVGRGRLVFPSLAADPARLAGVLLASRTPPGKILVNGRPAKILWAQGGRLLLDPEPFCRHENILSVSRGADDIVLGPVVDDVRRIRDLDLPAGKSWHMQTLAGDDRGPVQTTARPQAPASGVLEGLAQGLLAMVAGNGDVWSFYDVTEGTFRLAGWRWDTGIVLEALACGVQSQLHEGLAEAARTVGDRLLASRLSHPDCLGGFPEWTDLRYGESPHGISQWVVPFNAAFIAAGLMRLAACTDEPVYSQAARDSLFLAADAGLTPGGGISGYYFENSRQWRYLGQINDSGILGRGLALFPEEAWSAGAAFRAAEYILDKAAQPDGHIGRAWWDPIQTFRPGPPLFPEWKSHPGRVVPKVFLRGQAWVLLGLTGALRLGAGDTIKHGALRLVDYILTAQQADGSWLYSRHQPELGACAKTTAALALALAEWSAVTGASWPLPAAGRALGYLETCRRPDAVPAALAGLPVDASSEGCIIYFRNRPVVCAYTAALELLTRLALGEKK